jgi:hypothetical protein
MQPLDHEMQRGDAAGLVPDIGGMVGGGAVGFGPQLPGGRIDAAPGVILLEAEPGYFMVDQMTGDEELGPPRYRGTHGQRPHHPDNHALFVAAGRGVKRGVALGRITSRDVAPTLATLLDLAPAPSEGGVLTQALA